MNRPAHDIHRDHPATGPTRWVTDDERAAYERDGAALLKGIVPDEWVAYMSAAIDRLTQHPDPSSQNYAEAGRPRFFGQSFPWLLDEAFKAWALSGPMPVIARQVLTGADSLNFFYDQVFVKEPGTPKPTLWHQDYPYFPLDGEQILRIWVPFDIVTDRSGALHYLKGSHRWGVVYEAPGSGRISDWQPDFDADYLEHDWLIGESEPGDALLHHPKTVHGARANSSRTPRRAVAVVYTGDDVTWDPHPADMFHNKGQTGHVTPPALGRGDPLDCDLFPRV